MEARQKRIAIKNNLKGQLNTIVAKYVKPATSDTLNENSQFELAEKILFSNGGKLENVNNAFKQEQENYTGTEKYTVSNFVSNLVKDAKSSDNARTLEQILEAKANQLAPDPTIDIAGKAESLAGYKDSAFYTMDRDTVKDRLIAATGFTEPQTFRTTNLYDKNIVGTETVDPDIASARESTKLAQTNAKLNIKAQKLVESIGQYKQGVILDTWNNFNEQNFILNGVKKDANRSLNSGKFIPIMDKPKLILKSMQDGLGQMISKVINDGSFNPVTPTKSKLNIMPDLRAMVSMVEATPFPLEGDSTSIIDWSKVKVGQVYAEKGSKRKFIYYGKEDKNSTIVDVEKKFYFD
tara:strand:- start:624 stop:1676 length:1053 start_codon:yes stop_codon:yes gene_type:complete